MAIARSRGRLKGKQPKLPARQQAELVPARAMNSTGEYTIADLMEMFSIGRAIVTGSSAEQRSAPPITTDPNHPPLFEIVPPWDLATQVSRSSSTAWSQSA